MVTLEEFLNGGKLFAYILRGERFPAIERLSEAYLVRIGLDPRDHLRNFYVATFDLDGNYITGTGPYAGREPTRVIDLAERGQDVIDYYVWEDGVREEIPIQE